ncbi:hypothetical protein [Burkholderia cenocepacia]|uniref:hypothetical protein n=1 Tax=Burkholderia cenocepacia TaxID=95486 RepID=UPI00264B248E|nr:hypothetical protein [Burkholderia cenocepacia]MDN7452152.1 hypothetical protein [Burkholderia cenocepacia]
MTTLKFYRHPMDGSHHISATTLISLAIAHKTLDLNLIVDDRTSSRKEPGAARAARQATSTEISEGEQFLSNPRENSLHTAHPCLWLQAPK